MAFTQKRPILGLAFACAIIWCFVATRADAAMYATLPDVSLTDVTSTIASYPRHQIIKMPSGPNYIDRIYVKAQAGTANSAVIRYNWQAADDVTTVAGNTLLCTLTLDATLSWYSCDFPSGLVIPSAYLRIYWNSAETSKTVFNTFAVPSTTYSDGKSGWYNFGASAWQERDADLQFIVETHPVANGSFFYITSPDNWATVMTNATTTIAAACYSTSSYLAFYDNELAALAATESDFSQCNADGYWFDEWRPTPGSGTTTLWVIDRTWLTYPTADYLRLAYVQVVDRYDTWTDPFNFRLYWPTDAAKIVDGAKYFSCLIPTTGSSTFPFIFSYASGERDITQITTSTLTVFTWPGGFPGYERDTAVSVTALGGDVFQVDMPISTTSGAYQYGQAQLYDSDRHLWLSQPVFWAYRGAGDGTEAWCNLQIKNSAEESFLVADERVSQQKQLGGDKCRDYCADWIFGDPTTTPFTPEAGFFGSAWKLYLRDVKYSVCTWFVPDCDAQAGISVSFDQVKNTAGQTFLFRDRGGDLRVTATATTTVWLAGYKDFFLIVWLREIMGPILYFLTAWYVFRRLRNFLKH